MTITIDFGNLAHIALIITLVLGIIVITAIDVSDNEAILSMFGVIALGIGLLGIGFMAIINNL